MSNAEMSAKIAELMDLRRMQDELTAEIDALQDAIKTAMGDVETLVSGPYKVTYKTVTSTRIDTTALKKALPDIAAQYSKTTTARRFTITV